ncbi:phosphoglycerate dehydrogenase [Caenispirillum bisanense]|uniref:D-3-phosphoglycerate dehydrogenase n=1 Tax=Caenispirillum bisanense TaxID=414052 RepID=A0A286G903_9PROT|nr:phosphoglycerate dehydrogenase [Caenispirillum bisanense]SOD92001.1 D-3-phosphoglycerate dehydrogenase [Caenispirillum bisanense]
MSKLSLPKDKIKIVLLENVHDNAVAYLRSHGYENIESHKGALDADDLKAAIADAHMVGIRSRTKLSKDVLASAEKLMVIGAFCIGTNQIDLHEAQCRGIPVFNAPYSNTRSVAELVLGQVIMLARGIPRRNWICHEGGWDKSAAGSTEVRGKTLGIVGYGHIGTQLSVIAEALGMKVRFYDIVDKLALGNAQSCASLRELMEVSDFVSLHVPDTTQTRNMITATEIGWMKPGSFLVNAARGKIVDIDALAEALRSGHLAGAALDVFPVEPASVEDVFESPLRGMKNVILTPHIGGSTQEAQANIGNEVAEKLVKYSDNGSTVGAVNFPEVMLPVHKGGSRFMHIHRNVPGVISRINDVFGRRGLNIVGQYLRTDEKVGYVVVDVDGMIEPGMGVRRELEEIEGTIRSRFLQCEEP